LTADQIRDGIVKAGKEGRVAAQSPPNRRRQGADQAAGRCSSIWWAAARYDFLARWICSSDAGTVDH
jgi:hypothetical protein